MENNESSTDLSWVTFAENPYEIECDTLRPMNCHLQATTKYTVSVSCGCFDEVTYGYNCEFCAQRIEYTMAQLGTTTLNCSRCRRPSMEIVAVGPITAP